MKNTFLLKLIAVFGLINDISLSNPLFPEFKSYDDSPYMLTSIILANSFVPVTIDITSQTHLYLNSQFISTHNESTSIILSNLTPGFNTLTLVSQDTDYEISIGVSDDAISSTFQLFLGSTECKASYCGATDQTSISISSTDASLQARLFSITQRHPS